MPVEHIVGPPAADYHHRSKKAESSKIAKSRLATNREARRFNASPSRVTARVVMPTARAQAVASAENTNGNKQAATRPQPSQQPQQNGRASSPLAGGGRGGPGSSGRGLVAGRSGSGRGGPAGRGGGRGGPAQGRGGGGRSGRASGRQLSQTGRGGRGAGAAAAGQHAQQRSASAASMQQHRQGSHSINNGDGRPRLVRSGQPQSHPAPGGGPNTFAAAAPQSSSPSLGIPTASATSLGIGPDPAMLRASETSLYQSRIREGLCPTCGIQLFELKKPGLLSKRSSMKRIPINIDGVVFGGQCLKCNRPGGPATTPQATVGTARRGSSDPDFNLDGSLLAHPVQATALPSERSLHYHTHMQPDMAVPPGAHMSNELNASLTSFDGNASSNLQQQQQQSPQRRSIPPQQLGASTGRPTLPTSSSNRSISLRSLEGTGGGDADGISAIPSLGHDFSTDDKKRQLLIEQEILLNQFHASKISQMSLDQSALHSHISGHRRGSASAAGAGAGGATAVESTASPGHRSYDKGVGIEVNRPFGPNGGLGRQSSSRRGMALGRQGSNDRMPASVNEAGFRRADSNDADPMDEVDALAIKAINPDDAMVKEQMRIMEQIQKQNEATERRVADKALNMSGELGYTDKFAEQDEIDKAKAKAQPKNAERTAKTMNSSSPSSSPRAERAEADKGAGARATDSEGKFTVDIDLLDSNTQSDNIAAFVAKPKGEARTMEAWSKEWMGGDEKGKADKDKLDGASMSEKDRKAAERRRRRHEEKARRAAGEDIPKDIQISNHDSGSEISMGDARDAQKKREKQKQEGHSSQTEDLLAMDEDAIRKQEAILRDINQKKKEEDKEKKKDHHHHEHGRHRSKRKSNSGEGDQPPVPMTIAVPPGGGDEVGPLSTPHDLDDDLRDGCTYTGDFNADGLRHGRGTLEWANGDRYEGQFWNGMRHGVGKLMFADGSEYDGWWRYNRMDGHGTRRFPNGNLYVGNYSDGRRNGNGRHIFANGDQYVGTFKDDAMHGAGRYYFKNNESFEGTFNRGRKEGRGKYQWSDGTIDIIGYVNDVRSGEGVRYSADRKKAWKLEGSKVKGKISLDKAHKMVESLGSDVTIDEAA